jgi:hypothetical protein
MDADFHAVYLLFRDQTSPRLRSTFLGIVLRRHVIASARRDIITQRIGVPRGLHKTIDCFLSYPMLLG